MITRPSHCGTQPRMLTSSPILNRRPEAATTASQERAPSRRDFVRGITATTALVGMGAAPCFVPSDAKAAAEWLPALISAGLGLAGVLLAPVVTERLRSRVERAEVRPAAPAGDDFHARYAFPVVLNLREGLFDVVGSDAQMGIAGRPVLTSRGEFNERRDLNWAESRRIIDSRQGLNWDVPFGEIPADEMVGAYTGERERYDPAVYGDHYGRFVQPAVRQDRSLPRDCAPVYTRLVKVKSGWAVGYAFRSASTRNRNDIHFRLYRG